MPTGEGWSYPAFYTLASGSLGLQIGGQSSELVLTIMSEKALNAVINDQFKVGGNVDVAIGPVGKGLSAATATRLLRRCLQLRQDAGRLSSACRWMVLASSAANRATRNITARGRTRRASSFIVKFTNKNADILRDALAPYLHPRDCLHRAFPLPAG